METRVAERCGTTGRNDERGSEQEVDGAASGLCVRADTRARTAPPEDADDVSEYCRVPLDRTCGPEDGPNANKALVEKVKAMSRTSDVVRCERQTSARIRRAERKRRPLPQCKLAIITNIFLYRVRRGRTSRPAGHPGAVSTARPTPASPIRAPSCAYVVHFLYKSVSPNTTPLSPTGEGGVFVSRPKSEVTLHDRN